MIVSLPEAISIEVLARWLDLEAVARLDSACCSCSKRDQLLELLRSQHAIFQPVCKQGSNSTLQCYWLSKRELKLSRLAFESVEQSALQPFMSAHRATHLKEVSFFMQRDEQLMSCLLQQVSEHCPNMRLLSFSQCNLASQINASLSQCTNLEVLEMHNCKTMINGCFENILLPKLHTLALFSTQHTDSDVLAAVKMSPVITTLQLGFVRFMSPEGYVEVAKCCTNLHTLSITYSCIGSTVLSQISALCANVTSLDISHNSMISDAGVYHVAQNMKQLQALNLSGLEISENALYYIHTNLHTTLHTLYIHECTDFTVPALVEMMGICTKLHTISFGCEEDTEYFLNGEFVQSLRCIENVLICFSYISPQDIMLFTNCTGMKVFSIICTSESADISLALCSVAQSVPSLHTIVCSSNCVVEYNVVNSGRSGQNRVHLRPTRDCIQHEFGCMLLI